MKFSGFTQEEEQALRGRLQARGVDIGSKSDHLTLVAPGLLKIPDTNPEEANLVVVRHGEKEPSLSDWVEVCEGRVCLDEDEDAELLGRASRCPRVLDVHKQVLQLPKEYLEDFADTPRPDQVLERLGRRAAEWFYVEHLGQCPSCRTEFAKSLAHRYQEHWQSHCPSARAVGDWLLDVSESLNKAITRHVEDCARCRVVVPKQVERWVGSRLITRETADRKLQEIGRPAPVEPVPAVHGWSQFAESIREIGEAMGRWLQLVPDLHVPLPVGVRTRAPGDRPKPRQMKPKEFGTLLADRGSFPLESQGECLSVERLVGALAFTLTRIEHASTADSKRIPFCMRFRIRKKPRATSTEDFEWREFASGEDGLVRLAVEDLQGLARVCVDRMEIHAKYERR